MATQGPTTGAPASATFLTNEAARIATIMARFSKRQLQAIGEAAIDILDARTGDPEAEDEDVDGEEDGTRFDVAWIEWTGMRSIARRGPNFFAGEEDTEEDDGGGDVCTDDEPGFDKISRLTANAYAGRPGAGCAINGDQELNGDEGDHSAG